MKEVNYRASLLTQKKYLNVLVLKYTVNIGQYLQKFIIGMNH
jgi:hypothetical protein